MDKLLKVSEVADQLGMCQNSIYSWIRKGLIGTIRTPSGGIRIRESELFRIMEV
jgi:excisionase family DNA binding protein